MRRKVLRGWAVMLVAAVAAVGRGQGVPDLGIAPPGGPAVPRAVWRFGISVGAGQGDAVYVPITVLGQARLFVVDTGCETTLLDSALAPQLTKTLESRNMDALAGRQSVGLYLAPVLEADGRRLALGRGFVGVTDLGPFREVLGKPVEGILGMDVLRRMVMRVDFQKHELVLEEPEGFVAPAGAGVWVQELEFVRGIPAARMELLGLPAQRWGFDTGAGKSFAMVRRETVGGMQAFAGGRQTALAVDMTGDFQATMLEVGRAWTFAGVRYGRVELDEAPRVPLDLVGLEFLADYRVTFNFPGGRMYLEAVTKEHVMRRRLGFGAVTREGHAVIRDPSPALVALDVHEGDELVAVNGRSAAGQEPWAMAKELREAAHPTITVKRGERTITVELPRESAATAPGAGK